MDVPVDSPTQVTPKPPKPKSTPKAKSKDKSSRDKDEPDKKAMIRGVISYLDAEGLPVNKSSIFRHFGLSRSQGYAALQAPVNKRSDPEWEETRGRPNKVKTADQAAMEAILWDPTTEDLGLNWPSLAERAGVELGCNLRTLHRSMGTLNYRRCLGCSRSWLHRRHREKRVEYARRTLEAMPNQTDWRQVRFSGELHFGFGLDGKMRLIPRTGERLCPGCDQPHQDPAQPLGNLEGDTTMMDSTAGRLAPAPAWSRDIRRVHAWVAIGTNFKSELIFYEPSTSANNTGSLTMEEYRDKILSPVVRPWLLQHPPQMPPFILAEDADGFAHGALSKSNPVVEWKQNYRLRNIYMCVDSPDLNPLDTMWPTSKSWVGEPLKDWEDETLREAARKVWAGIEQQRVDTWVEFMPMRLRHVADSMGEMVAW